jgi:hypothetical protein
MAEWHPVHKPLDLRSGLETGGKLYDPPLLPYEIALIEALGCSKQEYKDFVRYARDASYVRPAEYDNIPEIYAAMVPVVVAATAGAKTVATTIAVNVAIGLALTAVSVLLAPKAPALESPSRIRGKKLADQIGPTRFNQTTSFDNVTSLAEYGQAIPIPFGKRGTGADGALTGGLILAPALVWSRIYSYGSYQSFEGIYVSGEYGQISPGLAGVRLETTALNSLGDRDYALYWSSNNGTNRLTPVKKIAGTDTTADSGTGTRQIFKAPTLSGTESDGFSMTYTPSSNTQFGTAEPIHNGSAYKLNWEIISAPYASTRGEDNEDTRRETQAKRLKIAGSDAYVLHKYDNQPVTDIPKVGMPGVGRAYSRAMGFVSYKAATAAGFTEYVDRTVIQAVGTGDRARFEITRCKQYAELNQREIDDPNGGGFKRTDTDAKDIRSTAKSWCDRASDLLTIGSKWIIAGTTWVVTGRVDGPTDENSNTLVTVELLCTAVVGVATLGIPGTRTVREPLGGYEGGSVYAIDKFCDEAFFNLCRLHMASIRPVRRDTEVIELGIRSQVWNRASGLCRFQTLPTPARLHKYDRNDVTLTTPRLDTYFKRTSCFSLWVRPVQRYGETSQQSWQRVQSPPLCVTGDSPIDIYNYLRIKPVVSGYYEYRLIPRTGSDIAINSINENPVWVLNASKGQPVSGSFPAGGYGNFELATTGSISYISSIKQSEEVIAKPETIEIPVGAPVTRNTPTAITFVSAASNTGNNRLTLHAWYTAILGYAPSFASQTREAVIQLQIGATNKTISLKVSATSRPTAIGPDYLAATNNNAHEWTDVQYTIMSSTGNWSTNDRPTFNAATNNVFSSRHGYTSVTFTFGIGAVQLTTDQPTRTELRGRTFEENTQVSDCSFFQELSKSNDSGPEHEIVYVNECISNASLADYDDMTTFGLAVKSSGQLGGIGQLRAWVPEGIKVSRLIENDIAASNLFADLVYYLLTNRAQGVGTTVPVELLDIDSLRTTARYLRTNKIFFDGVLEEQDSLRSFLYDNAALQLCNFTIKNGRFGMMPALPYDSNYAITTAPIAISQIFTSGNIIEGSLQVQYIEAAQRVNFRALVNWRVTIENDLPTQASALVDWADIPETSRTTTQQTFDLTDFCTNRDQALRTARFLLSIRRRVTHTLSFKTVPDALGIQPGSYIRVITESTSYSATNNGGITDAGTLVSITSISDGTYDALIYNPATSQVTEQRITIQNNTITSSAFYGCLFTLVSLQASAAVYQVEQLSLDEEGLVSVSAVHVPTNASGGSIVAEDVLTPARFLVTE